jgi:translation initiation factor IF-2
MGHVDHGKTSLLDYIRKATVADAEAGGITQHIGAYQVETKNGKITFIDTPGHAAFSKMRARGANATDIIILVVAADDGVMPQTIESIKHAKKAGVPMIVAINKIDKEGVDLDKIKQTLSAHDVISEDWGGEVMMIPVSAQTGEGVEALLEAITLTAEVLEFSAVVDAPANGTVLEARLEKGRGKVTTILVQSGTLKKGDIMIAGLEYGKVKQIVNDQGDVLKSAGPSMPVEVLGLSGVPNSGDEVLVVDSERKAREVADFRKTKEREAELQKQQASKMQDFLQKMEEGDVSTVNVLLKSDVRGSAQALVEALEELSTDEVKVKVVSSGVGGINNTDITLAATSGALVLGFNVRADAVARKTADNEGVQIEYYSIIYNLIDDVKAIMSGLLSPALSENIIGIANVKDVFRSQKLGDIAGCMVIEGVVKKSSPIRVLRDSVVIYEGELESLRRFKDDVKEVKSGTECGIGVADYNDIQAGDQIEVFERVETARTL